MISATAISTIARDVFAVIALIGGAVGVAALLDLIGRPAR